MCCPAGFASRSFLVSGLHGVGNALHLLPELEHRISHHRLKHHASAVAQHARVLLRATCAPGSTMHRTAAPADRALDHSR